MSMKARRNILKGLAVGFPAVWAKPVVESIVLPAHADTSPLPPCSVAAGCYEITSQELAGEFMYWQGGSGPHATARYPSEQRCIEGGAGDGDTAVIARSPEEAQKLTNCTFTIYLLEVNVALPEGCNFYLCD